MLPTSLNTNEVKNALGAEVEFEHLKQLTNGRVFAMKNEIPSQIHRLMISHQESGSGLKLRRRSVVRIDKYVPSTVDTSLVVPVSAYQVLDAPMGALLTMDEPKNVLAELMSFIASTGADTTIKFDCTGSGAAVLISGGQ